MGSDDLFRKLKDKAKKTTQREHEKKEPYPKFLIVCEDTVSGYRYLIDAVKHFRLSTANFSIVGLGQSPINIVDHAKNIYDLEFSSHRPNFEQVFCVFDRDTHNTYYNALSKIDAINNNLGTTTFSGITSNPCFEIWLLLHFVYTTKLYTPSQNRSASNHVLSDLIQHLPSYNKSCNDAFIQTIQNIEVATKRAEQLAQHCASSFTDSPSTKMDQLMTYISTVKQAPKG